MVDAGEQDARSRSFDQVAELYDRYRPGYPDALIEHIVRACGLGVESRILEIGCGAGQATLPLARRGLSMLCLEPGPHLAAVAARNTRGLRVAIEGQRFEDWQVQPGAFDLVLSADAFHWVLPEIGYARAAQALKEGGHLALFRNMQPHLHSEIGRAIQQVYEQCAPDLKPGPDISESLLDEKTAKIIAGGRFDRVEVSRFPWSATYTSEHYLGLLNTYSPHIRLPAAQRQCLFAGIAEAIDRHGGQLQKPYLAVLWLAQRASD